MTTPLTVRELIHMLEYEDEDALVYFSYPSGDYWKTMIAEPVSEVNTEKIEFSEYHRSYKVLDQNRIETDDDAEAWNSARDGVVLA
jgi:hypothetical protein